MGSADRRPAVRIAESTDWVNLIWCLLGACGMRQERVRHVRLVSGQLPTGDLAAVVTWQRVAARYRARPAGSSTQSTAPSPAPASLER